MLIHILIKSSFAYCSTLNINKTVLMQVDPAEENWIALDPPNKFQYCGSLDLEVKVQDTVKDELPAVQNLASNQMSLSLKENPLVRQLYIL